MPVYEFECPKGHITSDLVPARVTRWPCAACLAEALATNDQPFILPTGKRIMSATRTNFRFADSKLKS